ncbi:hypothetical protein PVAG01_07963, partial [Phlyctema vagabunda]
FTTTRKGFSRTLLSSVGGFSQPNRRHIRSLQQLLSTIRTLDLHFTPGHTLQEQGFCGEGVSYRVLRCRQTPSGQVVAVKQIKLPTLASAEAFERQVACVLRDIEVMSHGPLASHPNVLDIIGYGWDLKGNGSIPYLVTEYATEGTMRDYLRRRQLPSRDKVVLCQNVARGLHELHLCGMAHGDLKLDNVLITPADPLQPISHGVVAKISDFGHSLMLYEEGDAREDQRYGGTLAYNAPEILKDRGSNWTSMNLRKCDIWALGLLCWEALDNGMPFYKSPRILDLIAFVKTDSNSSSLNSASAGNATNSASRASSDSVLEGLTLVADRLQETALQFLESDTVKDLLGFESFKLKDLFKATLEIDPEKRIADIPRLPILLKSKATENRIRLGQQSNKPEWSFDMFRPAQMSQIPYPVKAKIFGDCFRIGSETGRSTTSAQAAFHVGIAYLAGFGTSVDLQKSMEWISKSFAKGLPVSTLFGNIFSAAYLNDESASPESSRVRYTNAVRVGFQNLDIPYLENSLFKSKLTYQQLKVVAADYDRESRESNTFSEETLPFLVAHYAVVHGLTSYIQDDDYINLQEPTTGETPLFLACRLGDLDAVKYLTARGADPLLPAIDGCLPIHWLWMFPPEYQRFVAELLFLPFGSLWSEIARQKDQASGPYSGQSMLEWVKQTVNTTTFSIRFLDQQLPLQLLGTPLSFAVAVASKSTVDLLLELGADSDVGPYPPPEDVRNRNPVCLAMSLHLKDILDGFLPSAGVYSGIDPEAKIFYVRDESEAWKGLVDTSPIERTLIHGIHAREAAQQIFEFVHGHVTYHGEVTRPKLAASAIEVCDVTMASIALPLEPSTSQRGVILTSEEKDSLLLSCTRAACAGGLESIKCIELLDFALSRGSAINCDLQTADGPRAVNIAIEYKHEEVLDWFLHHGVNLNLPDADGCYPLHLMIGNGFSDVYSIKNLLNASADPNTIDGETGDTPLHCAVKNLKLSDAGILLEYGADPATKNRPSPTSSVQRTLSTALHYAIQIKEPEFVELILKHAARIDNLPPGILELKDKELQTPLILAALLGEIKIVEILVESGAQLYAENGEGFNCLHVAARQRHFGILSYLIKKMGVKSITRREGHTALHLVMALLGDEQSTACGVALLEAGADPLALNLRGVTPLSLFALPIEDGRGHELRKPLLAKLAERQINLNSHAPQSPPVLYAAISNQDYDLAKDFMDFGASISHYYKGSTPLHWCASVRITPSPNYNTLHTLLKNSCKIAELLIERGADFRLDDGLFKNPLALAVDAENTPLIQLLLSCYLRTTSGPIQDDSISIETEAATSRRWLNTPKRWFKKMGGSKEDLFHDKKYLERLRTLSPRDREDVLSAWNNAISSSKWASVCAIMEANLHGSTDVFGLNQETGSDLLRYALKNDIGCVLRMFMGSARSRSDSGIAKDRNLEYVWKDLCSKKTTQKKSQPILTSTDNSYVETSQETSGFIEVVGMEPQGHSNNSWPDVAKDVPPNLRILMSAIQMDDFYGVTLLRIAQFIKCKGYDPALDLPSICAMGFIEAQLESCKESLQSPDASEGQRVFESIFFDEDDDDGLFGLFDAEIEQQLLSLLPQMAQPYKGNFRLQVGKAWI